MTIGKREVGGTSSVTCAKMTKWRVYKHPKGTHVVIKPLKARHDVTKSNLTIPLVSLLCIDIDLSI